MCYPQGKYYSCGHCEITQVNFCPSFSFQTIHDGNFCPQYNNVVRKIRELRSKCSVCQKRENNDKANATEVKRQGSK